MLGAVLDGLDTWLTTPDASVEKQAADNAIARLKDGAYYSNVAKQIANEKRSQYTDTQISRTG